MSKIKRVKRKDLDLTKYSHCLSKAVNYRIYAEVWYLDLLTNQHWECLVSGDYEVVMPIPLQFKFGIKIVTQPIFCQQLGVFYSQEISNELFKEFEKKLHSYRVRAYNFNEENTESFQPKGKTNTNQILNIGKPYEELRKNYNRNRRRKLIPLPDDYKMTISESVDDLVDLFQEEYPNVLKPVWVEKHKQILKTAFDKGIGYQCRIENEVGLVAGLFYIKTEKRIFQLGAGRKKSIPDIGFFTMIIDHVIANFAEQPDYIFDFEGSMIPGVSLFNESFGAVRKKYTVFSNLPNFKK